MLTAGEVLHIKTVIQDLLAIADPSEYTEQDVHHAIDLLDKIRPLDTEEVLQGLSDLEDFIEEEYDE